MADKIFGQGLDPVPLKLVQVPAVIPAFNAEPRPVYIEGLGNIEAGQGVAVPNAAAGTEVATINALLASLRAAKVIAT